ncbi:MAG: hypothetical protein HC862_17035 [Scytonema sp. RU_4_4]|nr:hypothetical protein [Scytonema sp. RU_4_4]
MYDMKEVKIFNLNVALLIELLKLKNQKLVYFYENNLHSVMGYDYTGDVFVTALFMLSETNSDILIWILKKLENFKSYQSIIKILNYYATHKLVEQGFTPGKDFSANSQGQILIKQKVKNAFLENAYDPEDRTLLQQILLVS